jgi:hypothetical protein
MLCNGHIFLGKFLDALLLAVCHLSQDLAGRTQDQSARITQ